MANVKQVRIKERVSRKTLIEDGKRPNPHWTRYDKKLYYIEVGKSTEDEFFKIYFELTPQEVIDLYYDLGNLLKTEGEIE